MCFVTLSETKGLALEILREVYPECKYEILRFAQNDKRRAQNDSRIANEYNCLC